MDVQFKVMLHKGYNQLKETLCSRDDCKSFNTATLKEEIRVKLFAFEGFSMCLCVNSE